MQMLIIYFFIIFGELINISFIFFNLFTGKDAAAEELERIKESRRCKICMDAEMEVVFLPCAHMATCSNCTVTIAVCPICRNEIKYTIKPIMS